MYHHLCSWMSSMEFEIKEGMEFDTIWFCRGKGSIGAYDVLGFLMRPDRKSQWKIVYRFKYYSRNGGEKSAKWNEITTKDLNVDPEDLVFIMRKVWDKYLSHYGSELEADGLHTLNCRGKTASEVSELLSQQDWTKVKKQKVLLS